VETSLYLNAIRLYNPNDLGNYNLEMEDDDRKLAAKDLTGRKRPVTELNFEENLEISRSSFLLADNIDDLDAIGKEWFSDIKKNREALSFLGLSDERCAELEQVQRQFEL
jgi:hypothetical protein